MFIQLNWKCILICEEFDFFSILSVDVIYFLLIFFNFIFRITELLFQ
jgi:hypothetical protein